MSSRTKNYTILTGIWDLLMICLTGGLWIIYIFIREMRNR